MNKNDTRSINVDVTIPTHKRLKILAINQDVSLNELVSDLLERYVSKKGGSVEEA